MVHHHWILLKFVVYDDYAGEAVHYYSNQSNNAVVGTDLDEVEIVAVLAFLDGVDTELVLVNLDVVDTVDVCH